MALELSEIFETPRDIVRSRIRWMARWIRRLLMTVEHHLEKRRSRRTLSELTDDELCDVGLTRAQARAETSKSWFWS
ncbi:DUF1127 domain-containing protein [Rhizobium leguminosarum]|jgi:uncharacterized protein YjiS (DUF1127 family)|uniref:DUF1127 domain-containing protein n=1 Tax=Rhizobium leguminosarum TaxID=384 RepID=UPI00103004D2|nr:DUF1127 domain-containing protein [Rhizobium leguminosarum]NKK40878.1 DUF1127 domain-containing protein [Rhizobium leguminosarum bv. viciae]QIO71898.1 DUF1127 domain-containing protein [Rhizobium leguminosarum bv. trifolii]QIO78916.1 DUF1127 domain-containing protein [Rhizobium leguminosarum bv. trifolii]TAU95801.1 DUF1127 domain-containing protein [Rhizobium leguminosarum]TAV10256.1 DUF1127 domain-containing protein [Rhizobium leguminosarum]